MSQIGTEYNALPPFAKYKLKLQNGKILLLRKLILRK
jgi:hypothetical protein